MSTPNPKCGERFLTPTTHLLEYEKALRKQVSYDPKTGVLTRIAKPPKSKAPLGPIKGSKKAEGHLKVAINGVERYFHQIAWFLYYGYWAEGIIDHIDTDPTNNRIKNLRQVTKHGNLLNRRKANKTNSSGLLGAHWITEKQKYHSSIWMNGKKTTLGYFNTAQEAHEAYVAAKRLLHPTNTL